jgi:hypothetical protein
MSTHKKFRSDYGVYLCPHVFNKEKHILEVVRDPDGFWQFFCGGKHDFENEKCHFVGVGHLFSVDQSIHELASMEKGTFAERKSVGGEWVFGVLDD